MKQHERAKESRLLHKACLHAATLGMEIVPLIPSYRVIYQCERGPDDDETSTSDDPRTLHEENKA